MRHLKYNELEMKNYFKSNTINTKKAREIFKYRTRMIKVGNNFQKMVKWSVLYATKVKTHRNTY